MNVRSEFEMFHYHASCAINHFLRFCLAVTGAGLEKSLNAVNYLHSKVNDPLRPEVTT